MSGREPARWPPKEQLPRKLSGTQDRFVARHSEKWSILLPPMVKVATDRVGCDEALRPMTEGAPPQDFLRDQNGA